MNVDLKSGCVIVTLTDGSSFNLALCRESPSEFEPVKGEG